MCGPILKRAKFTPAHGQVQLLAFFIHKIPADFAKQKPHQVTADGEMPPCQKILRLFFSNLPLKVGKTSVTFFGGGCSFPLFVERTLLTTTTLWSLSEWRWWCMQ